MVESASRVPCARSAGSACAGPDEARGQNAVRPCRSAMPTSPPPAPGGRTRKKRRWADRSWRRDRRRRACPREEEGEDEEGEPRHEGEGDGAHGARRCLGQQVSRPATPARSGASTSAILIPRPRLAALMTDGRNTSRGLGQGQELTEDPHVPPHDPPAIVPALVPVARSGGRRPHRTPPRAAVRGRSPRPAPCRSRWRRPARS
jgi:hypothetical protein